MTRKPLVVPILLLTSVAISAQLPVDSGSISGQVLADTGRPIPNARLNLQRLSAFAPDKYGKLKLSSAGFSRFVDATPDGSFNIPNLTAGRYYLCPYVVQPKQLSSCAWGEVSVVSLHEGGRISNLVRTVHDATTITLRISDPGGKIDVPDARGRARKQGRFILDLVADSNCRNRAQSISHSKTQHIYRIAIPRHSSMRLFIDTDLHVTDAAGNSIETGRVSRSRIKPPDIDEYVVDLVVN